MDVGQFVSHHLKILGDVRFLLVRPRRHIELVADQRELSRLLPHRRRTGDGPRPNRCAMGTLWRATHATEETPMTTHERIHSEVREHYADAARAAAAGTSACCGPDESTWVGTVNYDELGDLPDAAGLASLGCGNPTAVADLHEGDVVLDLGSGGGIDVLLSARRVGSTGFAYGLDFTPEMLELARRNAAEAGATNVEFLDGHIEAIPLPDASVDVVISNCVINLSPDKPAVFAEMYRVLRPGGRIGISDVVTEDRLSEDERRERGSYVGCIAGALPVGEYTTACGLPGSSTCRSPSRTKSATASTARSCKARSPLMSHRDVCAGVTRNERHQRLDSAFGCSRGSTASMVDGRLVSSASPRTPSPANSAASVAAARTSDCEFEDRLEPLTVAIAPWQRWRRVPDAHERFDGTAATSAHIAVAASNAAITSPGLVVPRTAPRSASVAWATGLSVGDGPHPAGHGVERRERAGDEHERHHHHHPGELDDVGAAQAVTDPAEQGAHRAGQRHQHDQPGDGVDRVAVEPEPEQRGRTDQQDGAGRR